ncbi:MAG: globin [Ectothiorhodospiraceae bacterium]|nr:globin [Ectothiorhodospiraceae bacterium]MCH8502703.1 globin [Ectothiorhodospiraceae bacterium]
MDRYHDVQQSYGRCLQTKRFIDRFYEVLMESHPAMRPAFARTDFSAQRRALRRGISTALMYAGGESFVEEGVATMAHVHSRAGRAPVEPRYYTCWLESLVQTIRESDPQLTPALERRWREAMQVVIQRFTDAY